tara:strand:+ start:179 stop:391 length:213 start_codon:yes stop_codon:yes gene_type:complete
MKAQLKENNFLVEGKKESLNTTKTMPTRPNIDNLIKRIIVEKRKERRRFFLVFTFVSLVAGSIIAFSFLN